MSQLIRMVYVSTTTNPVQQKLGTIQVDVGRILMQARKNNPTRKIGGVLYFSNDYFFQCLEGEQEAVNHLYQKILQDPRHKNVQAIKIQHIDERLFNNWSMKYVIQEDDLSEILADNGFTEFNPYQFDDRVIDSILDFFAEARDLTGGSDQDYGNARRRQDKPGLLSRLFKRSQAA
ncbi:MAG: BLUF domain-containing protein [Gammaproteobacteria bacterium]|nr:BLUF domain-containing protein [Gammaproteobacteria bacterium]